MTDSPTFRTAQDTDAEAVAALVQLAYRGEESRSGWTTEADLLRGQRTDAGQVRQRLARPGTQVLLLCAADGALLGCCELTGPTPGQGTPGQAYFGLFSIRPGHQGEGLGRLLLAEAERRAVTELGCSTMELTVITQRAELIAWYLRRGYRRTGERRPFPYGDERFGVPLRDDLELEVLTKVLAPSG
ncbi:GNAT family N-acetyltransferase [Rhodococcus sp. X156]|uniref:GNAT family N-acetyltransferase n=1 Tax=Rhodococcus sp. X156 TaxID=2499145 RepID=UPI001F498A28|nr:GNAT family N-acetyltransferase [Rhodococcus sp. X156]